MAEKNNTQEYDSSAQLRNYGITLDNITQKTFIPLFFKRFWYLVLKMVGSKTMAWATIQYLTAIKIMVVMAEGTLTKDVLFPIIYMYISQSAVVAILLGIIQFNKVNTDITLGKK